MEFVDQNQWAHVEPLFAEYTHQLPVIYSVLEGTAPGTVYVDRPEEPQTAVLVTVLGFLFAAGRPLPAEELEALLFGQIVPTLAEKDVDFFAPGEDWQAVCRAVFAARGGVALTRKIFAPAPGNAPSGPDFRKDLPPGGLLRVEYGRLPPMDRVPTWRVRLVLAGAPVSTCHAFLVGKGQAELDLHTEEAHRGRGYATLVARALAEVLAREGIVPCWNAWSFREASQAVARKAGFVHVADVPAWHWDESLSAPSRA